MAKNPKYKKTKATCNEFSKDFKDGPHQKKKKNLSSNKKVLMYLKI